MSADPAQMSRLIEAAQNGAFRFCVFRRPGGIVAALKGEGDLDILVADGDYDAFRERLSQLGARRGRLNPWHDNAVPGREDWFLLDGESRRIIHLDAHRVINAGPRFAKTIPLFGYGDLGALDIRETPLGPVSVAGPEFALGLQMARAAFRLRALWPFGVAQLDAPAGLKQGKGETSVAGRVIGYQAEGGDVRLRWGDLWALRRAIASRAGGQIPRLARHLHRMTRYKAGRLAERFGLAVRPKRGLPAGGMVVALVGPDGMGKSTQVEALRGFFSRAFATETLYLGSSGRLSALAMKLRGSHGPRPAGHGGGRSRPAEDFARACWGLWLAGYRRRTIRRARRLAARGYLVICDRWPQGRARGYLDGPVRRRNTRSAGVVDRLFEREARIYRALEAECPELMIHLTAPYEVVAARKPGELTPAAFDARKVLMDSQRADDPSIVRIDASVSQEEVTARLIDAIWQRI